MRLATGINCQIFGVTEFEKGKPESRYLLSRLIVILGLIGLHLGCMKLAPVRIYLY